MKEYIFEIEEEEIDEAEVFYGWIRNHSRELIRCRDCIYWKRYCRVVDGVTSNHVCGRKRELDGLMHRSKADDFCSWAERRNDETD